MDWNYDVLHMDVLDGQGRELMYEPDSPNPFAGKVQAPGWTVLEDGRVRFSLYYPNATTVTIDRYADKLSLTKEGKYFTGTFEMGDGFIPMRIVVDGNAVICRNLLIGFGGNEPINYIEVPEKDMDYGTPETPHGTVSVNFLHSQVTDRLERFQVYLPAAYDSEPETRFPVLYLQHGHGENEACWVSQGKMNFIMDALIAQGKAKPMIVVMLNGMVTDHHLPKEERRLNAPLIEDLLTKDIIPYIDHRYRTLTDREHRAMAGLSMGSMQSCRIGMEHQDLFAYCGLFSGFMHDILSQNNNHLRQENLETFNDNMEVFFRAMGDKDVFIQNFYDDDKFVQEHGIHCVRLIYDGTHEWKVWRRCLRDFAQMLFCD